MKSHITLTTTRGEVHQSVALTPPDGTDIDGIRSMLASIDSRGWVGIISGGKVAYVRASAIESIELWEEGTK